MVMVDRGPWRRMDNLFLPRDTRRRRQQLARAYIHVGLLLLNASLRCRPIGLWHFISICVVVDLSATIKLSHSVIDELQASVQGHREFPF